MSAAHSRASAAARPEPVGKRRLSKRNPSNSMLTTINTSSSAWGSNLSLRPSPSSSHSDNAKSPLDALRSPTDLRQQSNISLSDSGPEERQGGVRKKMSMGAMLGKKPSIRIGLGPLRSQSEASLAETAEERDQVLAQIKQKAENDRSIAYQHASSCNTSGPRAPNHLHPIRRRSLLTPGLATRDASDPLRKPPADGRVSQSRQNNNRAPISLSDGPPLSGSTAHRLNRADLQAPEFAPSMRLASLDLATDEGVMGTPRSSTPSECDYGRLGSGLRITNGIATSPSPSVGPGKWGGASPMPQRSHTMGDSPQSGSEDYLTQPKQPLKSRLYMIETVDGPGDASDESNIHPAFRSRPPFEEAPKIAGLSQQAQVEPLDNGRDKSHETSSMDLNKPLPTPPDPTRKSGPSPSPSNLSAQSRNGTARPDLEYRKREALTGDCPGRQEDLYDETLSLLDSIGSSRSNSSKPRITSSTTTTTTTTITNTTMTPNSPLSSTKHFPDGNKQTTTTAYIGPKSVVQTSFAPRSNGDAPASAFKSTTYQSPTTGNLYSNSTHVQSGPMGSSVRVPLVRNHDSGYSSSSYASYQSQQAPSQPNSAAYQTFGVSNQAPRSHEPQNHTPERPIFPSVSQQTSDRSRGSRHAHSSSESSATLLSIQDAASAPLNSNKKRLKKFRPASLQPVAKISVQSQNAQSARIPVQGQNAQSSSFIPPVPMDIAARHAQRSAEHPPLAHTVTNVGHTRHFSGSRSGPMSAPLMAVPAAAPSDDSPSAEYRQIERSNLDRADAERAGSNLSGNEPTGRARRSSKRFFPGRILKSADSSKSTSADSNNTVRSASRTERRTPSRPKYRGEDDFDEDEGAALSDVHEIDDLYGPSPYAAAHTQARLGAELYNQGHYSEPPRSRNTFGMTEAQASEVNRQREQHRRTHTMQEREIFVPYENHLAVAPMSAPASEQHFDHSAYANPYSLAYRNHEWDHSPPREQCSMAMRHGHNGGGDHWVEDSNVPGGFRAKRHADQGLPKLARSFSDTPSHASPAARSSEWPSQAPHSGKSRTVPVSPMTPLENHEDHRGYHDYDFDNTREQNRYELDRCGEEGAYWGYGGDDAMHRHQPGRYDGGFEYGYEHGRGVNGSAGTRGWQNGTSRKGVEMGHQYGIDLTDVPVFVARPMAT